MNLPNKLSLARVLCIPAIVTLLHFSSDTCRLIAAALFIIGCLTDFLDGKIARKRNLVTDFGKFIDPVADKLLVLSTMIMLIQQQLIRGKFENTHRKSSVKGAGNIDAQNPFGIP